MIAKRLGLAPSILESAERTVAPDSTSGADLLDEINQLHELARHARSQADRTRSLAENKRREWEQRIEEVENEKKQILNETYAETQSELASLRDEIARLKRAYVNARLPLDSIREFEGGVRAIREEGREIGRASCRERV